MPVDADSDDPFAVAEDLSGAPLVSTAANPEKEPEAAPEESAPAAPEVRQPVQADKAASVKGEAAPEKRVWDNLISAALGKKAPVPLPLTDLLTPPPKAAHSGSREDREGKSKALIACLKDFTFKASWCVLRPDPW